MKEGGGGGGVDRRAENSRPVWPMMESTAVVKREPGAEP